MKKTTTAYQIKKAGNLNDLRQKEIELPQLKSDQVLIDVKAIGLNYADIFSIQGLYKAAEKTNFVPGLEYAGKIIAAGSGVQYKVGDRIMGVTRFGAYTKQLVTEEDNITLLPQGWSFQEGASFVVQGLTAYYGLVRLGDLKQNQQNTILIHSAAGGVGLQANRIAKKFGAYTIGTIGHPSKIDLLRKEGYDDYIIRSDNFEEQLKEKLSGRNLNLIMECIGGKIMKQGFKQLGTQGRLINYGSAQYGGTSSKPNWLRLGWLYLNRPKIDAQAMIENNTSILAFNLIWLYDNKKLLREVLDQLMQLQLPAPFIGHQFTFDQLPEALKLFQTGRTSGKIIINT